MSENRHNAILGKYGIIVVLLLAGTIWTFISAARIAFPSPERQWLRDINDSAIRTSDRIIPPRRGNIYTHDGRLLAASESSYAVSLDFLASYRVRQDSIMNHVDALAVALAQKFPPTTAAQYRSLIVNGWQQRHNTRHVPLINRDISYLELRALRSCPHLFHSTLRRGLVATGRGARIYPFGDNFATRTIGRVHRDIEEGGSSGLEQRFDAELRGTPGVRNRQRRRDNQNGRVRDRWIDVEITPARDGYDIITTIDADIQEITYRALRNRLIELNAEAGTAIVMEVNTGAIRGISNLDRVRRGVYVEGRPNAFSFMLEPGSTFKTISTLIALEDGMVQPTDSFFVGNGVWRANRHLTVTDWNARRIDRGYQTVQWGMEMSSNVVMARMLLNRYGNNQERFIEGIDRIGITDTTLVWDVPLQGREGTMFVQRPGTTGWSNNTSLGVMSFGYATQIPPVRMLMFHNAIANGGKMVQPFVVQRIMRNGRTVQDFSARVVNPQIASATTLEQIHEMLVGVVENGTGRGVMQSRYFEIAGKTGTARIAEGGVLRAGHFVSFVGYFPADNPQYSIFVGIRNPSESPSGARMAGTVFRTIAEQIFVRNERLPIESVPVDTTLQRDPRINHGKWRDTHTLLASLRMPVSGTKDATDWVRMQRDSIGNHQPQALTLETGVVPDVRGMGARDALYLLESSGLQVNLSGSGRVVSQSLSPGSRLVRGNRIDIALR